MNKNFDNFISAYSGSSLAIKQFIDSDKIGIFTDTLLAKYKLDTSNKKKIVSLIADIILDVEVTNDTSALIKTFDLELETSRLILSDIKSFSSDSKALLGITETSNTKDPNEEIGEAENILNKNPQIRTMNQDMEKTQMKKEDVVHSTSQNEILKKPETKEVEADSRWSSET